MLKMIKFYVTISIQKGMESILRSRNSAHNLEDFHISTNMLEKNSLLICWIQNILSIHKRKSTLVYAMLLFSIEKNSIFKAFFL